MKSNLGPFIQAAMDRRGWSLTDLASESGISKGTISQLLNKPEINPQLNTLAHISRALDIPLLVLIEQTGVKFKKPSSSRERAEWLASLVDTMPWVESILPQLAKLSAAEQEGVLSYLQWVVERAEDNPSSSPVAGEKAARARR